MVPGQATTGGPTMSTIGDRAVVIGAGMGGLLAAGALAEHAASVTLIERVPLPSGITPRRAIPQGHHAHALLPRGHQAMEALFPGLTRQLLDAGAQAYRPLENLRISLGGHELARGDVGRDSIVASRPLIETELRRRVRALENVEIVDRCDALGLLAAPAGDRVPGVRIRRRDAGGTEETVPADLVVVATGRGGRLAAWLHGLGFPRPAEER